MKAAIAIALILLASTGNAAPGICPASRMQNDPCKLSWSEKYQQCIVANYYQCTGEQHAAFSLARMAPVLAQLEWRYKLPRGTLRAVAMIESSGNPNAIGRDGEIGLFQLMPATAKALGVDPHDPEQAAEGAARLLARYDHTPTALIAYNCGPKCVGKPIPPITQSYLAKYHHLMLASRS